MSEPKLKLYATWNTEEDDCNFWELHDTLEGAVVNCGSEIDIYEIKASKLGKFELKTSIIKIKEPKSSKK